jgi:hypothetical protein
LAAALELYVYLEDVALAMAVVLWAKLLVR